MHPASPSTGPVSAPETVVGDAELRAAYEAERAARIRAEEALRALERRVAEVESLAQLGSWEQVLRGSLTDDPVTWSDEVLRIHGGEPGAAPPTFTEFLEWVHPDDRARIVAGTARLVESGEPSELVYRALHRGGGVRWVHARARIMYDADGRPERMIGTSQDITERYLAEHALRERDRTLDEVEELARLGTWEWNLTTDVIRWSAEQLRIHGMGGDVATQTFAEFLERVHADDRARVVEECERLIATGESFAFPYRVVRPDGTLREMQAMGKLLPDATGKEVRMVGTSQDVTERNRADRALRASEARFRDLFEQFPHSVQILSPTGDTLQVNPAFDRLWGLSMEELAGYNPLHDPRMEPIRDLLRRGFAGERVTLPEVEFDTRGMHAEVGGHPWPRWIRSFVFAVRDDEGAVREVVLVHEDVTEQRRAEQALRDSERSYRALFELSNDPIYVHDVETGAILDANRKACEAGGFETVDEVREQGMALIAGGEAPFTPELAMEYVRRAAAGQPQRFEWRTAHPDVGQSWSEVSLTRVNIGGEDRLLATARDITERKRAEQALRDSERSYRTIFDWTAAALWVHDIDTGEFLDVNQTACAMHGYTVEETKALGVAGLSWGEPPYTIDEALPYIRRAVAGEPQRFEWLGRHKDGSPVWAEITLRRVTINGEDRLLATGRATNEWKAAEQALRASEESYRTIFDSTAAAIWVHDLETGELLEVNAAACELYGYSADEQLSIGLAGLVWGEAPYTLDEANRIFDLARAGEPQRFVWLGRHKGGGEVWAEMQARRVAGLGGDRLLVTARGMNEWRAAADALRRANEELEQRVAERTAELAETNVALEEEVAEHEAAREELLERTRELEGVFQALPDLYFRMDPDGTITDHRAGRAAALYSPLPDFQGRRLQDLLPAEPAVLFARALDEVGRTGELACVEYALELEGRRLEFEARVVPLEDGSRITVVRDITERKAAEAEISRQKVYFEEIIGSLESGVAVFDRELRYEYCSPNTIRDAEVRAWVVGHTVEEYGRRIGLSDEVIRERQESVERALAERAMVQFEEEIRRPDGTPRHMLRRALPLLDENGEVMRIIGYSIDISERKRAEEALQRSEEHFRTLIELSHDIITILDAEGRVVYQSPSLQRIMGYVPGELRGVSAFDLVHPDDVPVVQEAMASIVTAPGAIARAEYRYRHKDGSWRRLETFGRTLPEGVTEGVAVFNSRDVTERWEAERALREREEHFRRMIENASDMVQVIGADMRISYTGPSVERLLGYTPEEIQGTAAMEYLHPDDIPGTLENFAAMLASPGVPVTAEYRVRHKAGGWRDFEAQAMTLASDTAEDGIVINARDITERRRTQEALRRSEEHFRALIENAHDVITILDADGLVTYQSPSLARVAGYSPEERDGTHVLELVHPDDVETVTKGIAGVMEVPGTVGRVEFRFRHKDGRWLRLEALGRTLSPDSVAQGLVFNTRDITERWEIEQALQAREERFRRMIENASDLVQVVGPDTQIVYTGPSVERILGFTPEEIGGISALDYIHPDDIAGALKQFEKIVSNPGTLFGAEYRALHKDGRWRNMEAKGMTMLPDSAAEGVIVNARDVTERKATEEALQRSEEHFRALIENGTDYLMIVAPDTTITYVGPSVTRLLGYTPEEMLGRVAPDLVHPDDLPHVRQVMGELVAEPGKVKRAAWRIRHKDGGWREYEAFAKTLLPDTPDAGIVVNGRDMTERNAVERALQRSEEHFRALIENAHDLTAIIDASGRFVYQSPSMERIYGRVPGETLGHTAWELMHPEDVPAVKAEFARVLANPGSIGHVEYRYRHKDGAWIYTEAFGRTLLPDSAEQGVVVNARDVTERRLGEEALRRATADAERANRAKSEFLSRMSHELRTPMNSILGFAQVLARAGLPENHNKYLQHILKGGRHLLNLINEVLEISRIESGRQSLSLEPVHVGTVLQEALGLVRPLAEQRRVELDEAPWLLHGDAYVYADRQRLTQVVLNLLSNAVKYNRPGGRVRLWCAIESRDDGGQTVMVRIEDTGRGIPADKVDQLFTPFARLGAEQTEVEGTGLGLALSLRLAEAMGGDLVLESSGSAGSVFRLELRPADNPLNRAEEPAPPAAGVGPHRAARVLYIEDNLANLALVETFLMTRPEWQTIPALQGLVGLELAREHRPDLILLDLHLPDMHGSEVLRRLRADERTASVPVVVISADATRTAVEELLALGADAYLTKPLDLDEFLRTLEQFLPQLPEGA